MKHLRAMLSKPRQLSEVKDLLAVVGDFERNVYLLLAG
jgi:hypothetical protein